jgi:hypothetical protein
MRPAAPTHKVRETNKYNPGICVLPLPAIIGSAKVKRADNIHHQRLVI